MRLTTWEREEGLEGRAGAVEEDVVALFVEF